MTITLERARELLPQAVETQGRDFVYNDDAIGECYYEPMTGVLETDPRGKTGCLIGVALDLAGETRHHGYFGNVLAMHEDIPGMMTQEAALYLNFAQGKQDLGSTWGEAHDAAEEIADKIRVPEVVPV